MSLLPAILQSCNPVIRGGASGTPAIHGGPCGYLLHERLVDRSTVEALRSQLDVSVLPRTKAGAHHVLPVPAVRAVAAAPAMQALAGRFIGSAVVPFRATLFDKSAASNWLVPWHQDTALPLARRVDVPSWGPWSIKGGVLHAIAPASALQGIVALRLHLDDSTDSNGPLRVLPGTHRGGVLNQEQIRHAVENVAPVTCVVAAGGVRAMSPLLLHASSKAISAEPRRVLHIEYASCIRFGNVELAVAA